jgi:hypothetical protein
VKKGVAGCRRRRRAGQRCSTETDDDDEQTHFGVRLREKKYINKIKEGEKKDKRGKRKKKRGKNYCAGQLSKSLVTFGIINVTKW